MKTNRAEWARRIERWRASGLSAGEFGAAIGVKAKALQNWKWRLSAERHQAAAGEGARIAERPSFVEVVGPLFGQGGIGDGKSSEGGVELVLARGLRVRVTLGFDEALLRRVIETLEAR